MESLSLPRGSNRTGATARRRPDRPSSAERPHGVECGPRVFVQSAARSVTAGQDQRIEDGFGSARLDGFVGVTIAVVGSGLFPKAYTRGDVVQESSFVVGGRVIPQPLTESRAGEGVRYRRVAGDAERPMITGRPLPSHPPVGSLVEVSGRGLRTPAAGDLALSAPNRRGGHAGGRGVGTGHEEAEDEERRHFYPAHSLSCFCAEMYCSQLR